MACFGPDAPEMRNYAQETRDTLQAQIDLAPDLLASEQQFRPQYTKLNLDIARQSLPDVLAMYEQSQPALSRIATAEQAARVGGEVGLVGQYAGDVTDLLRSAAGSKDLLAELTRQAEGDLALGGTLDPEARAELAQSVRSGQAARGFGTGMPDINEEALMTARESEARKAQRRGFASGVANLLQTGTDPFMAILGRPSTSQNQSTLGQAAGFDSGNVFNPESDYAGSIYAGNQAYDWAYKQASPSTMAKIGMVSDTVGSFAGNIAGGMIGCWIAREAFGQEDSRWWRFRDWLASWAPSWLRWWYYRRGPGVAAWLKVNPWAKPVVRFMMSQCIRKA